METKISRLFDYGDEIVIPGETPDFDPAEIRAVTLARIHTGQKAPRRVKAVRRASRTLLIAALLAGLFTVTAVAAGISIHHRRQEELRQRNKIDSHQVTDYVEFETAEDAAGLTLLSTINDGDNQVVYLNLSPVEADEVYDPGLQQMMGEQDAWRYYLLEIEGTEGFSMLEYTPKDWDFPPEEMETVTFEGGFTMEQPTPEAMHRKLMESCYDAESKTLTLKGYVAASRLSPGQPVQLHVVLMELRDGPDNSRQVLRDFGTVTLTPTEQTVKTIWFDTPPVFVNEDTGEEGKVLGVELTFEGANWLVSFDSMTRVHTRPPDGLSEAEKAELLKLQQSWMKAEDTVVWNSRLNFADGSSLPAPGILRCPYEDGVVKLVGTLGEGTFDLNNIVSVTVQGETFPVR